MVSLTYQNIVDLIRDAATVVNPTGTFVHARRSDGSLEYDGAMPQIHLYPFQIKGSNVNQAVEADLIIGFWKQDSPASSNEEREAIISDMDILQRTFKDTLDLYDTIELLNFIAEPNYRQLSGTLSGYIIRFTLRGILACSDTPLPTPTNCPTLCERISDATAEQIDNCLSNTQVEDLASLICGNATAVLKNTDLTLLSTTSIPPNTTANITAPDATAVLKNTSGTVIDTEAIPSNVSEDITIPNVAWTDSDGSAESTPYGNAIVCTPQVKDVELVFFFTTGTDTSPLATNYGTTITLTATSDDGGSGTITFSVNGGAYAAFVNPTVLLNGDTIQVKRTITTAEGIVDITGTYA